MSLSHLLPRMKHGLWSAMSCLPLLIGIASLGYAYSVSHSASIAAAKDAEAKKAASHLAELAAGTVATSLQQFDRTLRAIIVRYELTAARVPDAQAANAVYFAALQLDPAIAFVGVTDRNGQEIAGRPRTNNNYANRDYFSAWEHSYRDGLFIGGRFSPDNAEAVGFTVSRAMFDENGNFSGLVVLGLRLAYLREALARLGLDAKQSLMLLRDDGVIVLRLPFRLKDVGDKVEPGSAVFAALGPPELSLVASDPIDHVQRHFAVHRVGNFSLWVAVGAEIDPAPRASVHLWIAAAVIVAIGFGVFAWHFRKQLLFGRTSGTAAGA